jgi:ferredoxin-type protein NapF
MDTSRRSFLRSRTGRKPVRPPWSLAESLFTERCTRCGDCMQLCETIQKGDGGFPEIRFDLSGCSFCEKCVIACKTGALSLTTAPWLHKAFIASSCLTLQKVICRTCADRCDAGAIHFRLEKGGIATPQLDPAKCNGCGMCIADCPVHAIALQTNFEEATI